MKFICEGCEMPCYLSIGLGDYEFTASPEHCTYDGSRVIWKPIEEVSE